MLSSVCVVCGCSHWGWGNSVNCVCQFCRTGTAIHPDVTSPLLRYTVSVLRPGHIKQHTLSCLSSELIYSVFICLCYTVLTLLKSQCLAFKKVIPHFCRYSCSFRIQILGEPFILEQILPQRQCQNCHGLLVAHFFLQGWLSCQISIRIRLIWILNFDHLTSERRTVFLNLLS